MAIYIVFRAVENIHPDPFIDVQRLRIDEVVCVLPSTHVFSQRELTSPGWRIVLANNLTMEDGVNFMLPEVETDPQNPNPLLMRRGWKFNRNTPGITQAFLDFLNDDTRSTPIYVTNFPRGSLLSMREQKPTRRGEASL